MWDDYGVIRPGRMPFDVYENGQIVFTQNPVAFDAPIGTVVGTISVINATPTYKLSVGKNPYFAISGNNLISKAALVGGVGFVQLFAFKGFKRIAQAVRVVVSGSAAPNPPLVGVFRLGLNLSGMEDNGGVPSTAELTYVKNQGIPAIRLPLTWAQMQAVPGGALAWGSIVDSQTGTTLAYNVAISTVLARAAAVGIKVMMDLHNFGQDMTGGKIGQPGASTPAQFADFWHKFVTFLMADPNYSAVDSIDLMNEWSNMDLSGNPSTLATQALILNCNTLALAAVRGAGYSKRVYLEWDHFSGFWDSVTNNVGQLMDLAKSDMDAVVQLHGYLDDDASGTHGVWADEIAKPGLAPPGLATNVNIGPQRMAAAVALASSKGVRICLGETGWSSDGLSIGGNDDYADWNQAAFNLLQYCQTNNIEIFPWGAGPGFPPSYIYNPEPTNVSNPGLKDFTSAGLQSTQMVILQQFSGYTGAQPLAYRADLPFGVTPYTPSGTPLPNFKIRYNGVIPATITFTGHAKLADGTDAGGTFSSITLAPGNNGIATFSYTPAISAAGISLTFTNNRGLIDPPAIGISSLSDWFIANNISAGNVFWVSRLVGSCVSRVYTLGRDVDSQTLDVSFNNAGNLPRQAVQDFASSRSVKILKAYNQNPNFEDIDYGAGPYPLLILDDGTGYPSILNNNIGVNFSSGGSVGATQLSIFAGINPTNTGIFLSEDVFVETFRLDASNFSINQQSGPGTFTQVATAFSQNAWQLGQFTWSNLYGTSNLKAYKNGTAGATANAPSMHLDPAFGQVTLGTFRFGGPAINCSYRGFVLGYQEANATAATDFWNRYHTYYTTALPDSLSPLPPTILNVANSKIFQGTSTPFFQTVIADGNPGQNDSVVITLSGASATLTGTGITGSNPYTIASATPASVTATLQALVLNSSASLGSTINVAIAATGLATSNASFAVTVANYGIETAYSAPVGAFTPPNMKGVWMSGGENSPTPNYPHPFLVDYYSGKGFGLARMSFASPPLLTGGLGQAPLNISYITTNIKSQVDYFRSKNQYVVLDLHQFGFINGPTGSGVVAALTESGGDCLIDFWSRLASLFKNYDNVMFEPMNEPVNGTTAGNWAPLVQKIINAIRLAGANQKILIEGAGNSSGAHDWTSSGNAAALAGITDTANNFAFAPHQYLDSDNSGTHPVLVSGYGSTALDLPTTGLFTTWCRSHGFKAILTEGGFSPSAWQPDPGNSMIWNDSASSVTTNGITEGGAMASFMSSNSDVFLGWAYGWSNNFGTGTNADRAGTNAYCLDPPYDFNNGSGELTPPVSDRSQMAVLLANLASTYVPTYELLGF